MRRSLTLIELIFSMVIVAIAFTAFPKILQVSAKSSNLTLKEEAMYNAVALMGLVRTLAWDERNTQEDDILLVDSGDASYECRYALGSGEQIYRRGGFVGSRNCQHKLSASAIGSDADDNEIDDIDDLDKASKVATNVYGKRSYLIDVNVSYVQDFSGDPIDLRTPASSNSTNVKYIQVTLRVQNMQETLGKKLASFWYISSNIGQLRVNSMAWVH